MELDLTHSVAGHIAELAVYTGVATINGQKWIANVDYSASVNLNLQYKTYFATRLGLYVAKQSNRATNRLLPMLDFSALSAFSFLIMVLTDVCQTELGLGMDLPEMIELFTESVRNIPEAQPMLESLVGLTSFSHVHQVRRVLAGAVHLAFSLDERFTARFTGVFNSLLIDDSYMEPTPETQVSNNLQIPLQTTDAVPGLVFGHDFFVALARCANEQEIEMATPFVTKDIVIRERHRKGDIYDGDYEEWEVLFNGVRAFEAYIEGEWVNKEVTFEISDFESSTMNGNGKFKCRVTLADTLWGFHATAVNGK
ncbi:UNVERIFIED_CONTAM: hypothetical protein HDU68_005271, partial [Siphonaria sp. JEL0065]